MDKEAPTNEGMLISAVNGQIRIEFTRAMQWFAMDKDHAIQFALRILAHCGVPVQINWKPDPPPAPHAT